MKYLALSLMSLSCTVILGGCLPTDGNGLVADGINAVELDKGPYNAGGGSWNTGRDTYEFAYTVRNVNGKAAICGVLDDDTSGLTSQMNQRMRDFEIRIDGVVIGRGFNHFTRVEDSRARGLIATCKVGSVDWQSSFSDFQSWRLNSLGDGRYAG